jgi:hypothetical protein
MDWQPSMLNSYDRYRPKPVQQTLPLLSSTQQIEEMIHKLRAQNPGMDPQTAQILRIVIASEKLSFVTAVEEPIPSIPHLHSILQQLDVVYYTKAPPKRHTILAEPNDCNAGFMLLSCHGVPPRIEGIRKILQELHAEPDPPYGLLNVQLPKLIRSILKGSGHFNVWLSHPVVGLS